MLATEFNPALMTAAARAVTNSFADLVGIHSQDPADLVGHLLAALQEDCYQRAGSGRLWDEAVAIRERLLVNAGRDPRPETEGGS